MKAAAVMLFVGALLLSFGSVTKSWLHLDMEEVGSLRAGLFSYEMCHQGECESGTSLKGIGHANGQALLNAVAGLAGAATGVAASILALLSAILALTGKPKRGLGVTVIIVGGVALLCAPLYLLSMQGMKPSMWSYGVALYALGAVLSLTGGIVLAVTAKSARQTQLQGAPLHPNQAPCPNCRKPMQFIAQYQRWFCAACNRYV